MTLVALAHDFLFRGGAFPPALASCESGSSRPHPMSRDADGLSVTVLQSAATGSVKVRQPSQKRAA